MISDRHYVIDSHGDIYPISKLKIGDKLMGYNGDNIVDVLDIKKIEKKRMYQIYIPNKSNMIVGQDFMLPLKNGDQLIYLSVEEFLNSQNEKKNKATSTESKYSQATSTESKYYLSLSNMKNNNEYYEKTRKTLANFLDDENNTKFIKNPGILSIVFSPFEEKTCRNISHMFQGLGFSCYKIYSVNSSFTILEISGGDLYSTFHDISTFIQMQPISKLIFVVKDNFLSGFSIMEIDSEIPDIVHIITTGPFLLSNFIPTK